MTPFTAHLLGLIAIAAGCVLVAITIYWSERYDEHDYDLTNLVRPGTDAARVARLRALLGRDGRPAEGGSADRKGGVVDRGLD